ncbi:hypothetical protein THS27_20280 [Thalassospira sp. MCCC 1A01428]|nr:hypothetical protein THS27_20280 [Thalassospira sp. MCCC 1A01428]
MAGFEKWQNITVFALWSVLPGFHDRTVICHFALVGKGFLSVKEIRPYGEISVWHQCLRARYG